MKDSPQFPSNLALSASHAKVCAKFNISCWGHFLSHELYQNPGVFVARKSEAALKMPGPPSQSLRVSCAACSLRCSQQPPCGFPPAPVASELRHRLSKLRGNPRPHRIPPLGVYSVSWCNPLCLVFKTPASIPSFPCPVAAASSETRQYLGDATFSEEPRHWTMKVKLLLRTG